MTDTAAWSPLRKVPWVVRIRDTDGRVCGGGVVLGREWVLTCAHVIPGAGGEPPTTEVVVDSPMGRWAKERRARVDQVWVWSPRQSCLDLTVLQMERGRSDTAGASFAWDPHLTLSHPVATVGYPQDQPEGHWMPGIVLGPGAEQSCVQVNATDMDGVKSGFSGSPVIDCETGMVLGILVSKYEGTDRAWMLPMRVIKQYIKDVPHPRPWLESTSAPARSDVKIGIRLNVLHSRLTKAHRAVRKVLVRDVTAPAEQRRYLSTDELASTLRHLEIGFWDARRKDRPMAETYARLLELEREVDALMTRLAPAFDDLKRLETLRKRLRLFQGEAARCGVAERPEILRSFEAAHSALSPPPPCDVAGAEQLVQDYVHAVRGRCRHASP